MKKLLLVGFGSLAVTSFGFAGDAPPAIQWEGGDYGVSWASSVQQTQPDGGFVVCGTATDLLRTDADGKALTGWPKRYSAEIGSFSTSVKQTTNGDFIITGYMDADIFLLRTDLDGNPVPNWPKYYGTSYGDFGFSVTQTQDRGFFVAGYTSGPGGCQIYVTKTDGDGKEQAGWPRTYGGPYDDFGFAGTQTTDGGYVVAGATQSAQTGWDVVVYKFGQSGNLDLTWPVNPRIVGDYSSQGADSIQQTRDGGYIVAGYTKEPLGGGESQDDAYIIKLNSLGELDLSWSANPKTIGTTDHGEVIKSVTQTRGGGYIAAGHIWNFVQPQRWGVYLIRLDVLGDLNPIWPVNPVMLNTKSTLCTGNCVVQTGDGGYIIAGQSLAGESSGCFLCKLWPEPDCNENDILDATDIANGTSQDCNCNRIPDECDLASGTLHDANTNGIPDECEPRDFVRGDANMAGRVNSPIDISDAVFILNHLFDQGPSFCKDAMDTNDDGKLDIADAVYLLSYLFTKGPAPMVPFPEAGLDPTPDCLGCDSSRW